MSLPSILPMMTNTEQSMVLELYICISVVTPGKGLGTSELGYSCI
jgi:hypothetical protein